MKKIKLLFAITAIMLCMTSLAACGLGGGNNDDGDDTHTHDYEWAITVPPTVDESGEETQVCKSDTSHIGNKRTVSALNVLELIPTYLSWEDVGHPERAEWYITGCDKNISGAVHIPSLLLVNLGGTDKECKVFGISDDAFERTLFQDCVNLTSVTFAEGIKKIGQRAFARCTGLADIQIPDSITSIGVGAFANTAWYNNKPDGLVYISHILYNYKGTMPSDASITVSDGTKVIAEGVFSSKIALKTISIPQSVIQIGKGAFYNCSNLTDIHFEGTKEQWNAIVKGTDWNTNMTAIIHCIDGDI